MEEVATNESPLWSSDCVDFHAESALSGRQAMWDIGCIAASVLFFVVAIGYTIGCERLGAKEKQG
jgi:hypothetical protein